jgi:hypothetical protein
VRALLGAPVEVGAPVLEAGSAGRHAVLAIPGTLARPRWPGTPLAVLSLIGEHTQVEVTLICSRSRHRPVVQARRLALWVWTRYLGRAACEMAGVLGLSSSSASELLRPAPPAAVELEKAAGHIAERCWLSVAGPCAAEEAT